MPFHALEGNGPAALVLKQIGDNLFEVEEGFRYDLPDGSAMYRVPKGFHTDLASVPWFLWWLVDDTLIGSDALVEIPRKEADWVLHTALEDTPRGEKKGSWMRHWMTWVAVCVFGTMLQCAKFLFALFLLNVVVFWFALISRLIGWEPWARGWVWWLVAVIAGAAGFLWTFNPQADRRLSSHLWPIGAIGLALVTPALIIVLATALIVAAIDLVPALKQGRRWPVVQPFRLRYPI
jgi:Protein of unknown function (DUF1353)